MRITRRPLLLLLLTLIGAGHALAANTALEPDAERQRALVHLVRQDCGSCHGLTLNGGIGPALTATALARFSPEIVAGTILNGRPGTPMPPFRGLITERDARWIARQLLAGFPKED